MIRTEVEFADVPVIFLTSKNDRESITQVMALRPDGYLLKTMKPEDIVKNIDDFFEKQKKL
jgi:DNA-binding NarL/FixJ family response regulator